MRLNTVYVLMSTYNGQSFLREQIDSILDQVDVSVRLRVRDDGSTDSTRDILAEYEARFENVKVWYGDNVGYARSFMRLVRDCPVEKGSYYAFSDQDDYWDSRKLSSAISKLEKLDIDRPALYYSDLKVVDRDKSFIRMANAWEGSINKYMIACFIGIRGCTMVYNNALQGLLYGVEVGRISGHDTYIALLAFWLGSVVYDDQAFIDYRQTGENLSITGTSAWDHLLKNFEYLKRRFTVRKHIHELNACEVIRNYGERFPEELFELRQVAEYRQGMRNRFRLMFEGKYKTFSLPIRMFNDILVLFGKL